MSHIDGCGRGSEAEVRQCASGHAMLHVISEGDPDVPVRVCVTPARARLLVTELRGAWGHAAPVILDRPVIVPSGTTFGAFRFAMAEGRRARVSVGGNSEAYDAAELRSFAAIAAEFADELDAAPDPADVRRLAEVIGEHGGPHLAYDASKAAHAEELAAFLLRSGKVTLTGEDGSRA